MPDSFKDINLRIHFKYIDNEDYIHEQICRELHIRVDDIQELELLKRSIDARKKDIKYNLRYRVHFEKPSEDQTILFSPENVKDGPAVHIIGAGPAGLFAALRALEVGLKQMLNYFKENEL